jgi:hypothetical protein
MMISRSEDLLHGGGPRETDEDLAKGSLTCVRRGVSIERKKVLVVDAEDAYGAVK